MKCKVLPNTKLFRALQALYVRIQENEAIIQDFVKEIGAKDYYRNGHYLSGGIEWFDFGRRQPAEPRRWKANKDCIGAYALLRNKQNKKLLLRLGGLPTIGNDELLKLLKLSPRLMVQGSDLAVFYRPALIWGPSYILFSLPDECKYVPPAGIKEILVSEYIRLEAGIKLSWHQPDRAMLNK